MFPDVELSLEELVKSHPLFHLEKKPGYFFVGTSDKRLGVQVHGHHHFELGFYLEGKPHGHCRKTEIGGNLIDGMFTKGSLNGPAVCFIREMEVWTYGLFKDDELKKTKEVYPYEMVPPLVSLQELPWPIDGPKFSPTSSEVVPFFDLDPFYFSEIEADYIRSAMEGASIPITDGESGIDLFLPLVEAVEQGKPMEAISEEPTLEDEDEEDDLSTRIGDKSVSKKESVLSKYLLSRRDLSNRS
jgi:hypothetical protein